MSDFQVARGSKAKLDRVDGELRVARGARIEAKNGDIVYVSGPAYFDGGAEIACNFECDSLKIGHGGVLKIEGDLVSHGLIDVEHSIRSSGLIKAENIDVGGRLNAKSVISTKMRVGGTIDVSDTLEVQSLDIGGKVDAHGTVKIVDFTVGGKAEIGGGTISGNIRVGGKFEAHSPLQFGDMQVLGQTELHANSKGSKISSFGKVSVSGDLECDQMTIAGQGIVNGNCKSKKIVVNGNLHVSGSLEFELLEVNGSTEVEGNLIGENVRVAGKVRANKAIVRDTVQVLGYVETDNGLKAKNVFVNSGSRLGGVVIGENVEVGGSKYVVGDWQKSWMGQVAALRLIGKETRVGDVYADKVHVGTFSRCGKIFARVVEFEDGVVLGEISYTEELKGNLDRAHVTSFVTKVSSLPNPPL